MQLLPRKENSAISITIQNHLMAIKKVKPFKKSDAMPLNLNFIKKYDGSQGNVLLAKSINIPKYNTDKYYSEVSYRPISKLF